MWFEVIKALHIIFVICWFAMLFYLPRLFVYHAMAEDQVSIDRFKIMERKLYYGIGMPSMILTIGFGFWYASISWSHYAGMIWFWIKVALVAVLIVYHHACGFLMKQFRDDKNTRSHVFFRWFNEFPVVLLIIIVLLVVLKRPL